MTSKNLVEFCDDPAHVTLGLQLPWRRFALSECFLLQNASVTGIRLNHSFAKKNNYNNTFKKLRVTEKISSSVRELLQRSFPV